MTQQASPGASLSLSGSYGKGMLILRGTSLADMGHGTMRDEAILIGARTQGQSFVSGAVGIASSHRTFGCDVGICPAASSTGLAYELTAQLASRYASVGAKALGNNAGLHTSWDGFMIFLALGRF